MNKQENTSEPQKKTKRHFSAQEKGKILKMHLVEKQSISSLCEKFELAPSRFYDWQKALFTNASSALETKKRGPRSCNKEKRITELEDTIKDKNRVIAELMAEYLEVKKNNGARS